MESRSARTTAADELAAGVRRLVLARGFGDDAAEFVAGRVREHLPGLELSLVLQLDLPIPAELQAQVDHMLAAAIEDLNGRLDAYRAKILEELVNLELKVYRLATALAAAQGRN
jgi:hypothetical protein